MFWEDYILKAQRDAMDDYAWKRYVKWANLTDQKADRADFIKEALDPDTANEFCYYPVEYWDRVIRWHKEISGFEVDADVSAPFKILRAGLLYSGVDPNTIGEDNCEVVSQFSISRLRDVYAYNSERLEGSVPPFEEATFGINPYSGYIRVLKSEEVIPEPEEDGWTLDDILGEAPIPEGDSVNGYWLQNPDGETHLYLSPELQNVQYKKGIVIWGCDRFGNKLHPNDPSLMDEKKRREQGSQSTIPVAPVSSGNPQPAKQQPKQEKKQVTNFSWTWE